MKKYEILKDEFITLNNENTLYRIRACKDIKVSPTITIHKGDIGGYIECEANLEQIGNCWVCENAKVYGNAWVYGDALVYGDAKVSGDAKVYGNAWVCENAKVFGDAKVYGNAEVYGNCWVCENAKVCETNELSICDD